MSFVKLDCGIADSSLWIERDTRSVFITALVMAEPLEVVEEMPQIAVRTLDLTGWVVPPGWYGIVHAAGTGIVRRDGCDEETGLTALEELGAPDPHSRSQEYEGRRLVRVNGGYIVLNYFKYRDRDYTAAERMRRLRARRKANVTRNDDDVTRNVTQAEDRGQSTEVRVQSTTTSSSAREELLSRVPHRATWEAELNAALHGMHGPVLTAEQVDQAIGDYLGNGDALKPNLRHFRGYLRDAGRPKPLPASNGSTDPTIAALEQWKRDTDAKENGHG